MEVESESVTQQNLGPTSDKEVVDLDKDEGRKEMAPRSDVWPHFIKNKNDNGVVRTATCKYCRRNMNVESNRHGTSALKRHLNVCKRNPHKFNKDPTQGTLQVTQGECVGTWKFDQNALRVSFAEMIIEDELPFCFGEKAGFRKFMSKACPRFEIPSRRTTTRDVVHRFFQEKAKLKKFFKDSCQTVCLTTDCWTSQQQNGYMTVTASFIDANWMLHKKIIGLFMVKGDKGDDIGRNVMRCLDEWGLERVLTVTVDNASANDTGIGYLRRQLMKMNIANGKFLHMRCAAHIVNLIVQDGLKEVDLSLKRVRAAVRYIRKGGSRIVKFKEIVEEEKMTSKPYLKLDVPTRWNSTYIMLRAAIVYEKVFTRLVDEDVSFVIDLSEDKDGFGHPDEFDWENVRKMAEFLEHFHDLTERVSATLHVTSHTFFQEIGEVHLLIQSWLESTDVLQSAMGKRMKDKFNKYWGLWHTTAGNENDPEKGRGKGKDKENLNLLIFVAGCLDPRYKLSLYTKITVEEIFGEEKGQLVWEAINTCLHELFQEYITIHAPSEEATNVSAAVEPKGGRGGKLKEVIAKRMKTSNGSGNSKSELGKYLAEETEDTNMKIDLLVWWKASEQRFPIISRLARDVLAIPISSVASESAFSTTGRILDDFRSSLTPFMLEVLVCAQDWLRWPIPLDIKENMEELVILEKELIKEFGPKGKGKAQASTSTTHPSEAIAEIGSNSTNIIS